MIKFGKICMYSIISISMCVVVACLLGLDLILRIIRRVCKSITELCNSGLEGIMDIVGFFTNIETALEKWKKGEE